MAESLRVVLDTNVLISAVLNIHGAPGICLQTCRLRGYSILLSEATFEELRSRLAKPKFDRYRVQGQFDIYLRELHVISEWLEPVTHVSACRDPDDDKFLALAAEGGASVLVTGDRDLLAFNPFRGVEILTPTQWLQQLGT